MRITWLFFLCLFAVNTAHANPVSFKDGWGIMPTYGEDWSDLQINYSVTNRYSIGISDLYREGEDSTSNFIMGQYNYLIKRWNELESQANIYASVGLGGRHDSEHGEGIAGYGALEADYETRRIYTLLGVETLQSEGSVDFTRVRARAGFAPYKAPIESLQTWIILQGDYMTNMDDSTTVTPLIRFFYNNYALEIGASFEGTPFIAAMAHF